MRAIALAAVLCALSNLGMPAEAAVLRVKPGADLSRTLLAARDARRKSPRESVTIELAGGDYFLPRPLVLGPEDSGLEAAPLEIRSAGGSPAVLRAARQPLNPEWFMWNSVFRSYTDRHPESDRLYRELSDPLPTDYLGVSLLDGANTAKLELQ